MKTLPDQIVAEAFALSNARGAELLARLGGFNVWQGDLATMRGDNPRAPMTDDEPPVAQPMMQVFLDTLLLTRAIELLEPECRAALADVYAERKDTDPPAADLDRQPEYAQSIMSSCEKRLLDIYEALIASAMDDTMPQWVTEREHAVVGNSRR